jgi:hypothetical protein
MLARILAMGSSETGTRIRDAPGDGHEVLMFVRIGVTSVANANAVRFNGEFERLVLGALCDSRREL